MFYRYTPDRKGEHLRAHLNEFCGILQADGYAGFAKLYVGNRIVEAACLAHARRKLWDMHATTKSPLAREALDRIATLYRIEDTIRGKPADPPLAHHARPFAQPRPSTPPRGLQQNPSAPRAPEPDAVPPVGAAWQSGLNFQNAIDPRDSH